MIAFQVEYGDSTFKLSRKKIFNPEDLVTELQQLAQMEPGCVPTLFDKRNEKLLHANSFTAGNLNGGLFELMVCKKATGAKKEKVPELDTKDKEFNNPYSSFQLKHESISQVRDLDDFMFKVGNNKKIVMLFVVKKQEIISLFNMPLFKTPDPIIGTLDFKQTSMS